MSYKLLHAAAQVKDLTPYERCVLITLAYRANPKTNKCFPSVGRMARDTSVSEREVHRALKKFRALGLITISGKTKHGTNVYLLHLKEKPECTQEESDNAPLEDAASADPAVDQCHPVSPPLTTWQTNKGKEPATEQEKKHTYTSTMKPVLAHALAENKKPQTGHTQHQPKTCKQAFGQGPGKPSDSKLVQTWKAVHAKAGLKCFVNAVDGKKLSLLVKGEKAISYQQAIETLIPQAVAHWTVMCVYLTIRYGISFWGKKPVPKWPHTGFLLAHRQGALEFCATNPLQRECLIAIYVKPALKKKQMHGETWGHETKINETCNWLQHPQELQTLSES